MNRFDGQFRPYVPVAERKKKANKAIAKLSKKGKVLLPVVIEGRTIAKTFWGKAWCDHLESFSDFENRLPRGRTYVRNGSVLHVKISEGKIEAIVQGSSLYTINIVVQPVEKNKWQQIVKSCTGEIDSVVDLLQGKLAAGVMKTIADKNKGLFPLPREIALECSCPDWADMCKHVAAVLYGVGARFDHEPELLFKLRHVDHLDLINRAALSGREGKCDPKSVVGDEDLSSLFGIEIEATQEPIRKAKKPPAEKPPANRASAKKTKSVRKR